MAAIIYTDIMRDGVMLGLNIEATLSLAEAVDIPVIASGGLASPRRRSPSPATRLRATGRSDLRTCIVMTDACVGPEALCAHPPGARGSRCPRSASYHVST